MRQRERLFDDVLAAQADTDMPFADESMPRQAFALKYLSAVNAMRNIGMLSTTADFRSIGAANANIMEKGCLSDESDIYRLMG